MIFLAFLLPLAIYLLVLGYLNNREHPTMVSGPWDFVGLLFAASGFLLFGGPAILGSFSEHSRLFWLFGAHAWWRPSDATGWWLWIFLSALYFSLVVGGAAFFIRRSRAFTSIYNVERAVLERALHQACINASVPPFRSGDLFLFGLAGPWASERGNDSDGMQARAYRPIVSAGDVANHPTAEALKQNALAPSAVLEVDSFPWLRHVSLRWDPANVAIRTSVEAELGRILKETTPPDYVVSFWMTVLSQALFIIIFLGGMALLMFLVF